MTRGRRGWGAAAAAGEQQRERLEIRILGPICIFIVPSIQRPGCSIISESLWGMKGLLSWKNYIKICNFGEKKINVLGFDQLQQKTFSCLLFEKQNIKILIKNKFNCYFDYITQFIYFSQNSQIFLSQTKNLCKSLFLKSVSDGTCMVFMGAPTKCCCQLFTS